MNPELKALVQEARILLKRMELLLDHLDESHVYKADNRIEIEVQKHYGDLTKRSSMWVTEELLDDIVSRKALINLLGLKLLESIEAVRENNKPLA